MASTPAPPVSGSPKTPVGVRSVARRPVTPAGRVTEAARTRTLQRDKDNFGTLQERSKKLVEQGPFKMRPPAKISTKTIDTDTIGRVNKANQKMSQFLYNLANEPSVGLFHVNEHIRRTVPRLVENRKQVDFQRVELDKSSHDIDDILPTVRTIGSLTAFKTMQSTLLRCLQLTASRPTTPSASTSLRSLGPATPTRTPVSPSSSDSQRFSPQNSPAPQAAETPVSPSQPNTPSHPSLQSNEEEPDHSDQMLGETIENEDSTSPFHEDDTIENLDDQHHVEEEDNYNEDLGREHEEQQASNIESSAIENLTEIESSLASTTLSTDDSGHNGHEESKDNNFESQETGDSAENAAEIEVSASGEHDSSLESKPLESNDNQEVKHVIVEEEASKEQEVLEPKEEEEPAVEAPSAFGFEAAPKSQPKKKKKGGAKQQNQADLAPKAF